MQRWEGASPAGGGTLRAGCVQCNAMQCNAVQCNAMQCNVMQCSTARTAAAAAPRKRARGVVTATEWAGRGRHFRARRRWAGLAGAAMQRQRRPRLGGPQRPGVP